jgi:hypothetical protein
MSKYWIFDGDKSKFVQVDKSRLDFTYPFTPRLCVKFNYRKSKDGKVLQWKYVHYGITKQECWDSATKLQREEIEKLKKDLEETINHFYIEYGARPENE